MAMHPTTGFSMLSTEQVWKPLAAWLCERNTDSHDLPCHLEYLEYVSLRWGQGQYGL
jgi:hypothetical protein